MKIIELELSVRAHNVLKEAGIETVEALAEWPRWEELLERKNCGAKTLAEIACAVLRASSGALLAAAEEWDKKHPPRPTTWEVEQKAKKYDKIASIVNG